MSRGPGHVERAIAALFEKQPDAAFTVTDLVMQAWPGLNDPGNHARRVAAVRAARNVAKRLGWFWLRKGTADGTSAGKKRYYYSDFRQPLFYTTAAPASPSKGQSR